MSTPITLSINGESREVDADSASPLLYALRDDLALNGPKFGCGLGQCGACMVLMDGEAVKSCQLPVVSAQGHDIVTLEGLATDAGGALRSLQEAFIEEQAAQCGFCLNGAIMAAAALLRRNSDPSRDEILAALSSSLCRCGTHSRIIRAVEAAAKSYAGENSILK